MKCFPGNSVPNRLARKQSNVFQVKSALLNASANIILNLSFFCKQFCKICIYWLGKNRTGDHIMAENGRCIGFIHTVEKGDTLYLLGKKYGVRVSALIFMNPYVDVYNMQIGDEICIPKLPQWQGKPCCTVQPRES